MIVRILNQEEDRDRFYDCRNTCLMRNANKPEETLLIFEFLPGQNITVVLRAGDKIYYMNDAGKTVHSDCRMA